MTRLPTTGGDTDAWGTVLNDYLTRTAQHTALASSPSAGATSFDVAVPSDSLKVGMHIVVDAYTSQAEIRKIATVASSTITVSTALEHAHAAGDQVLAIVGHGVPAAMWGALGDNSTDDLVALQEAVIQCSVYGDGLWLDGQNRAFHMIGQPLMISNASKIRHLNIRAKPAFAPAETNNAMIMCWAGNVKSFTADPSTNIITATAHGLPEDNVGVVFQGTSLPGGLTAGKFYYAINRTTDTFKVSTTSGGSEVDITSAGSGGRVFCEVYAQNAKPVLDDCYFDGQLVTGLNGMLLSIQQPGYANKLRVDNFDGSAIIMKGQQYVIQNLEMIQNRRALDLRDMSELYVYGLNIEQCNEGIYAGTGGAFDCAFYGMHIESNGAIYGISNETIVYLDNGGQNLTFHNIHMAGSSTATFLKADAVSAGQTSYQIEAARWVSGIQSTGQKFVVDVNRNITLDAWDDCHENLQLFMAPRLPSSQTFDDPRVITIAGPNGRMLSMGSQNDDQAQLRIRPASSGQTGAMLRFDNNSDTELLSVNPSGHLVFNGGPKILGGTGSPESAVIAPIGSLFLRSDGGANTSLYIKQSGSSNTGWAAVTP